MNKVSGMLRLAWPILKWVLLILSGAVIVIFLIWFVGYLREKFNTKTQSDENTSIKDETKDLTKVGLKATYSDTYYRDMASQFFEKFREYDLITKAGKDDIMPYMLRLRNYIDFLKFKEAFGIREETFSKYTLSEFVIEYFDDLGEATYNGYVRGLLGDAVRRGFKV